MKLRTLIVGILVAALVGGIGWFQLVFKPQMMRGFITASPQPVPAVSTEAAKREEWVPRLASVGTLRAIQGVSVAPETAGMVRRILFDSGQSVERGQLLVQLDDAVDQADLKRNEAALANAQSDFERQGELLRRGTAAKANFDDAKAKRDEAAAALERIKAVIEQKAIEAPFAGRLGMRRIDLGQYIAAGTALVWLQAIDPIYADFPIPEKEIGSLAIGQTIEIAVDAYPDQVFTGKIESLDALVAQDTRSLLVRARAANADGRLLPGMFANVAVFAGGPKAHVTLPRTAVSYSLYGDFVYVVKEAAKGPTVERRVVRTGETRGERVAILDGVAQGDQVVTAGQLKLQPGGVVRIDNSVALAPSTELPKP